jgi:hypothetical protein
MESISNELRSVIERRLRAASPREVLTIASALCADEPVRGTACVFGEASKPARFELRGDLVIDHRTGLMWTRENVPGGRMDWAAAKKAAAGVAYGGHTDWRLPTVRELLTIVDYERHQPSINTDVFKCEASWYWTSTPLVSSPGDCAWCVGFSNGDAYWDGQYSSGFVRACRAGQSVENWF